VTVNRRAAIRHEVAIAVNVQIAGHTLPSTAEAPTLIENLSLGGAFLSLHHRLTIGTRVSLRFRIPTHDHPIETPAVVRWSTETGAGVQFDGLRAIEVWSLNRFFETL
jgi:hypothetical protein